MNQIQVVFLIVSCYINGVVLYATGSSSSLPDFIKPCKGNDPNLNDCVTKTGNEVIPHLIKGYRPLNMPSFDPLVIEALKIENGHLQLEMKNMEVHNLKSAKLINSNVDLTKHVITLKLNVKDLTFSGIYEMSGQILVFPLNGKGPCKIVANDGDYTVTVTYSLYEKNGVQYAKVEKIDVKLDIKGLNFNFENLISTKKEISDNMNKVLNENWQEMIKELEPAVKETLYTIAKQVINGILDKVPYMDLWDNEHP
ncbi:protein takeout-like [Chrysoperla carnea]|uniref:protein takeout-like n=1 Tax=Chrysoperla carnea TaxID=189513 RepID=UPI001D06FB7B|nr:protein takeout-like [Chrysoperla carnea]